MSGALDLSAPVIDPPELQFMSTNAAATVSSDIKDVSLSNQGKRRMESAFQSMSVLQTLRKQFIKAQPFAGCRIGVCARINPQVANGLVTLRDGGAALVVCSPESLSIQDDVAAALVRDYAIPVYAVQGSDAETQARHVAAVLDSSPEYLWDECGRLASVWHARPAEQRAEVRGCTERDAGGARALRTLARDGALGFPALSLTDSKMRRLVESRYGAGQSAIEAIIRATDTLIAGTTVVIAGFGPCGSGLAVRARGFGANVVVTEVHPVRAVEAVLEGFRVMTMQDAAAVGDIFVITTTGRNVLARDHFERMKDGAILATAGPAVTGPEMDLEALGRMANARRPVRELVEEIKLRDGRKVYLLAEGRPIEMPAAGQPAAVADMALVIQALAVEYMVAKHASLGREVHGVPEAIDRQAARMKLDAMSIAVDKLTIEQEEYLAGWSEGN